MENYIVGALAASGFWLLLSHSKKNNLKITWWQWLLTVFCGLFAVFTSAVILEFIHEGTLQGALVAALVLGITAVIGWILVWRFVFAVRQIDKNAAITESAK